MQEQDIVISVKTSDTKRVFRYEPLRDFVTGTLVASQNSNTPARVFCDWDERTVEALFMLQTVSRTAHVILRVDEDNLIDALKLINLFDTYVFTLVPHRASREFYWQIFEFFFYSSLSVVYVTWIGHLLFRYRPVDLSFNQYSITECKENCSLQKKGCRTDRLAMEVFYPDDIDVIQTNLNILCSLQTEFAHKAAEIVMNEIDSKEFHLYLMKKREIESSGRFWLDPIGVFA